MPLDDVIRIAEEIREKSEKYVTAIPKKHRSHVYTNMSGLCAIASKALVKQLKEIGIDAKFIAGYYKGYDTNYPPIAGYHCWVEAEDKIVDITATQFVVEEPVHIANKDDIRYNIYSVDPTMTYFYDWPMGQKPSQQNIRRLLRQ